MKNLMNALTIAIAFVCATSVKAEVKSETFNTTSSSEEVIVNKADNSVKLVAKDGVTFTVSTSDDPACLSYTAPADKKVYKESISVKADKENPSIITVVYDVDDHYVYAGPDKEVVFGGEWTLDEINAVLARPVDGVKPAEFSKVDLSMVNSSVKFGRNDVALANPNIKVISADSEFASDVDKLFDDDADYAKK